jgi:hypothetical protein
MEIARNLFLVFEPSAKINLALKGSRKIIEIY